MTLCSRIFLLFSHVFISQGQGTMKMCKICILHRSIRHIFISSHLHQWLITFLLLFLQMGQGWPPDPRGDRRQLRGGGGPLLLHRVCVLWGDQRPGEHQHQQKRGRVLWAPLFFPLFHSSTHSPDTVGLKTFFSAGPQSHLYVRCQAVTHSFSNPVEESVYGCISRTLWLGTLSCPYNLVLILVCNDQVISV